MTFFKIKLTDATKWKHILSFGILNMLHEFLNETNTNAT